MESIDKLREYVKEHTNSEWAYATAPPKYPMVNCADVDLLDIADAIEQEVEDVCAEAYGNGVQSVALPDMTTYVKLPVDADGVPIHVGDVMEWPYGNGEFRVNGIGGNTLFYIDKDSGECELTAAGDKRHHHAPTVEDVLREFVDEFNRDDTELSDGEIIERFAAKLRLAEWSE